MNKSLLFILLGLTDLPVSAISDSRDKGDCRQAPDCQQQDPRQHMTNLLSLRSDQVESVMQVLKASHEQRKTMHQSGREQHKALHEKTLQQLEPLLDQEQMARFVSFSEAMKQRHQQRKRD